MRSARAHTFIMIRAEAVTELVETGIIVGVKGRCSCLAFLCACSLRTPPGLFADLLAPACCSFTIALPKTLSGEI
jgi:hypothetical protein